jgi:CRP-like cAMP-binding protein
MNFRANSVIYFRGDVSDRIYILKAGRVSLTSTDIETGEEIYDYIQTGEFFGVKSALGKYPREETAAVLADTSVLMFTVPEFEQLVSQNTRIIMKMLKVFSNQLRRLHTKVTTLLAKEDQVEPEAGLFNIGQHYLGRKLYPQALHALRRYLTYYPSGRFHTRANELAGKAEQFLNEYGSGKGPNIDSFTPGGGARSAEPEKQLSAAAKEFYGAVSAFSQQRFAEAQRAFANIAETSADEEYRVKALFEMGRCYHSLGQHDTCIKHYTGLIQRFPKAPEVPDALFYIGRSYHEKGDSPRAQSFYRKITSMPEVSDSLLRKVRRAMKAGGD